jgi:hypothetical protein
LKLRERSSARQPAVLVAVDDTLAHSREWVVESGGLQ